MTQKLLLLGWLATLTSGASFVQAQPLIEGVDVPNASRELREILYERFELQGEIAETKNRLATLSQREARLSEMVELQQALDETEEKLGQAADAGDKQAFAQLERDLEQLETKLEHQRGFLEIDEALSEAQEVKAQLEEFEAERLAAPVETLIELLTKYQKTKKQLLTIYLDGPESAEATLEAQVELLERRLEIGEEYLHVMADLREAFEEEAEESIEELMERAAELGERLKENAPAAGSQVATLSGQDDPSRQPIAVTEAGLSAVADLTFDTGVIPFLETYCYECHGNDAESGELNLEKMIHEQPIVINRDKWINVLEQTKNRVMPPDDGKQPHDGERTKLVLTLHNAVHNFDYRDINDPGYETTRRLTHDEYDNTMRDLFGVDIRPTRKFPADLTGSSGFDNSANTLFVQPILMERYIGAAELVVESALPALATTAAQRRSRELILGSHSEEALEQDDAAQRVITRFMQRAYRRPATPAEIARAMDQFHTAREANETAFAALKVVLRTCLISPKFLMRSEQSVEGDGAFGINDWELASRLSYFLWSSMPDPHLDELAGSGRLHEAPVLRAQIARMITDPKSSTLGSVFAAQWLGSRHLGTRVRMDPIDNPWCTDSLMSAMREETAMFFHTLVRENQRIPALIEADFTYLNEELAKHYKIRGIRGESMQRVSLQGSERGGIFGHGSLLAVTSFPYRTSPVVRGKWILADVLGTPPPPPPPNVSELPEEIEENDRLSFRQKLELHRTAPNCYACHSQMDPLGFSLEGYDFFGRERRPRRRRSKPDTRGRLPNGTEFEGLPGLKQVIVEQRLDDLCKQVAGKMLSYALGRQLEYYDEPAVRKIVAAVEADDYQFHTLVHEVVNSYPFQFKKRRVDE